MYFSSFALKTIHIYFEKHEVNATLSALSPVLPYQETGYFILTKENSMRVCPTWAQQEETYKDRAE